MSKVEPITPENVVTNKRDQIPDEVIQAWNNVIAKNFDGKQSHFTQSELTREISKLTMKQISELYGTGWLDLEPIYRKAGWNVYYDRPAYNEDYEPTFTFTLKD